MEFEKSDFRLFTDSNSYYRIFRFDGKDHEYTLSDSESFLLSGSLNESRIVNSKFEELYTALHFKSTYWKLCGNYTSVLKESDMITKITSDGRYFKFNLQNGESQTVDLGYNFISKSKDFLDFRSSK